jgi:hypothetical protein
MMSERDDCLRSAGIDPDEPVVGACVAVADDPDFLDAAAEALRNTGLSVQLGGARDDPDAFGLYVAADVYERATQLIARFLTIVPDEVQRQVGLVRALPSG